MCLTCNRALREGFAFCCLSCKISAGGGGRASGSGGANAAGSGSSEVSVKADGRPAQAGGGAKRGAAAALHRKAAGQVIKREALQAHSSGEEGYEEEDSKGSESPEHSRVQWRPDTPASKRPAAGHHGVGQHKALAPVHVPATAAAAAPADGAPSDGERSQGSQSDNTAATPATAAAAAAAAAAASPSASFSLRSPRNIRKQQAPCRAPLE